MVKVKAVQHVPWVRFGNPDAELRIGQTQACRLDVPAGGGPLVVGITDMEAKTCYALILDDHYGLVDEQIISMNQGDEFHFEPTEPTVPPGEHVVLVEPNNADKYKATIQIVGEPTEQRTIVCRLTSDWEQLG